ncbi:hypothetical protein [Oscillatoria sp. FACHB-1406]|uniref:hypothetical protein n=1 Tax=Oscillatoria sp. FACHB-1406 TaxID=2692846 RepID=UPI0016877425|nr:hypothetical protein [Oscillatoria sp. FACHB-1406]MBD2577933.1 hypothetical protein [Oscillatoria sp. FACHB-1406]
MASPSCTLWITVARTDIPFMMQTIPHLVKMSHFPFNERVLAVDRAELTGDKVGRPGIGTMEELRDRVAQLIADGVVDRAVDMRYDDQYRDRVYRKHFRTPIRKTHNYKGYPILGTIFTIEESKGDYMLHYDSDMLLYQESGYSWIEEAIELIKKRPELMSLRPLTGPPTDDGTLYQRGTYERDSDGFYRFKSFSSRVYLIQRKGFNEFLPLPVIWRSYRIKPLDRLPVALKTFLNNWTGRNELDSWEVMVSQRLKQTHYYRGVLATPKAWTLHPKDRSPEFIQALPDIIQRIERGEYPPEQAGHYDLISDLWF